MNVEYMVDGHLVQGSCPFWIILVLFVYQVHLIFFLFLDNWFLRILDNFFCCLDMIWWDSIWFSFHQNSTIHSTFISSFHHHHSINIRDTAFRYLAPETCFLLFVNFVSFFVCLHSISLLFFFGLDFFSEPLTFTSVLCR